MNGHDAARTSGNIIHQHMVFHGRTIETWICSSAIQKVMTAKSREAGWWLQKSRVLFGFGYKTKLLSALCFQLTWLQSISRLSGSGDVLGLPLQAVLLAM